MADLTAKVIGDGLEYAKASDVGVFATAHVPFGAVIMGFNPFSLTIELQDGQTVRMQRPEPRPASAT